MPNILKVTTPAAGYDNNSIKNNPTPAEGMQIRNPVDPSKVTRSDNRTDAGQNQDNKQLGLNYESNFENFVHLIKTSPELAKAFTQMMLGGMDGLISLSGNPEFLDEMAEIFQMISLPQEDMLPFLKEQVNGSVRFTGKFFNVLRAVLGETDSLSLKADVLDFVKKYADTSSSKHLFENIMTNLKGISSRMFSQSRGELEQLMEKLDQNAPYGETVQNASVLKNDILPFIGKYIMRSHDMGTIRDIISLLTVNIARYENGSMDGLVQSFKKLLGYPMFKRYFGDIDDAKFRSIMESVDFEREAGKSAWTDKLQSIIERGIKGEAGVENKPIFENMMYSMLLNESVYMPVLHFLFPFNLNGQMMFSEFWVDPDAEDAQTGKTSEHASKILIKFEIKDLGSFDMILYCEKDNLSAQIYYPDRLKELEPQMLSGISGIISRNRLNVQSLVLNKGSNPKSLLEIFPKIQERRNTVNVRV